MLLSQVAHRRSAEICARRRHAGQHVGLGIAGPTIKQSLEIIGGITFMARITVQPLQ